MGARLCHTSQYQGLPILIFLIRHAGPWHPTCGLVSPWKPKLGLFSQNCSPTRSCKDKWAHPPRISIHDIKLKNGTCFPSWENCLARNGWARLSKSSSRSSKSSLFHLACGPLTSNQWACSPMEAQARLVLPKLSTN